MELGMVKVLSHGLMEENRKESGGVEKVDLGRCRTFKFVLIIIKISIIILILCYLNH